MKWIFIGSIVYYILIIFHFKITKFNKFIFKEIWRKLHKCLMSNLLHSINTFGKGLIKYTTKHVCVWWGEETKPWLVCNIIISLLNSFTNLSDFHIHDSGLTFHKNTSSWQGCLSHKENYSNLLYEADSKIDHLTSAIM